MTLKRPAINLHQLLDAAEVVVLRDGINGLTLDAVASEAKVSKGGLLHHYPSKERLIEAMVVRIVGVWRSDALAAIDAVAPGPGRVPRGLLAMCLNDVGSWTDCLRKTSIVLLAALTQNPKLVEPLRNVHAEFQERLRGDGLKPGYGEVVVAAIDGLWFASLFGVQQQSNPRLDAVRTCLEGIIERGIDPAAQPATGPGSQEQS